VRRILSQRRLFLVVQDIFLSETAQLADWELLAQAAQAMKQQPLVDLAADCHPQTLRQMRWANAHLKEASPQVIAS
jgi:hypothetical protein